MLLALVEEQVKQGLEPIILSAGNLGVEKKSLELEAEKLGLSVKIWRMKPGLNFKEAWKIIKWAKAEGVNVLHSHGYKFNILMGCFSWCANRIPLLVTVHGYTAAERYSSMWLNQCLD